MYLTKNGSETKEVKAYFDNIVLVEGNGSGYYSMVDNGGFENGMTDWENCADGLSFSSIVSDSMVGRSSLKIDGEEGIAHIFQDVWENESSDESYKNKSYLFSCWAKADSAINEIAYFQATVLLYYTDETTSSEVFAYNKYCSDWQYVSGW